MTSRRTLKICVLRALVLLIAVTTVLISFAAPAQQANAGERVSVAKSPGQEPDPAEPDSGNILFLPAVVYDSGGTDVLQTNGGIFQGLAVADLNSDGKPDLVVSNLAGPNQSGDGVLGVLLGNGDGTFKPALTFGSGGYGASSVVVADINGDGMPDVLVANTCVSSNDCTNGTVSVFLGKGNGTFRPPVTYSSGGQSAVSVAVADVNGDGKLDLLVANQSGENNGDGSVGVLLGNGNGTFRPPVTYDTGDSVTSSLAVADLKGNGKQDLVVTNSGHATVNVLLGNGDGTFQAAVVYSTGGEIPVSVAVEDVNGDGKPDLIVANWYSGTLGVLLGNGDGTFQAAATYSSGGSSPDSVVAKDVNGDGKLDLVAANCGSSQNSYGCGETDGVVSVLLGHGDGTFQPAVAFSSGAFNDISVAVADVNGDGKLDILVGNQGGGNNGDGSVGVLLNNTEFTPTTIVLVSSLNPSLVGQAVTFTARMSSIAGTPPNGETITFHNGSAVLGTGPLSGGIASLMTSSLAAGIDTITASYGGDGNFGVSTSPELRQVVNATNKSATAVTLIPSLNPSIYGQAITWSATVTTSGSIAPTGTVNFTWGYNIGTATLNGSGVATLTRSNLNADLYPLAAVYSGDVNNERNTSAILSQVIQETTSSATLISSPNPSTRGEAVTFTATITSPTVRPTGPVTFTAGKTVLGTAQLSNGRAKFTTSTLPVGSTTVTATYYGDSNIAESSALVIQKVQQ
ncbi:MAG: FG-GAP-like repeat-containing protein [Candidatus Sulfotelmatobacter sp.]